jgi:predicted MPP superfamily phosphohydrolase
MTILLAIAVCGVLLLLYARFVEPHLLVVRKVRIESGRNINGGKPIRVTLLSDTHYPRYASFRMVRRAIEKSNAFEPDYVFLLGDFFDKHRHQPAVLPDHIGALFQGIQSRGGVFGVLGNHDYWFNANAIRKALAEETEIRLIDNQSVRLEIPGELIYLSGVGDVLAQDVHYEKAVIDVPQNASIILLSHNPDVVEEITDPRVFVQFSGHTHGGQVRLPFIGALKVPSKFGNRYAKGLVKSGSHLLYVNSGICSMKWVRFLCPPEVTWVEIY